MDGQGGGQAGDSVIAGPTPGKFIAGADKPGAGGAGGGSGMGGSGTKAADKDTAEGGGATQLLPKGVTDKYASGGSAAAAMPTPGATDGGISAAIWDKLQAQNKDNKQEPKSGLVAWAQKAMPGRSVADDSELGPNADLFKVVHDKYTDLHLHKRVE